MDKKIHSSLVHNVFYHLGFIFFLLKQFHHTQKRIFTYELIPIQFLDFDTKHKYK